jgi:peptide/nickel transport system ATP-binding protein
MDRKLLEVRSLKTYFKLEEDRWAKAVDGVDFSVASGKTLCIVGESGCGKSITALSIMDLIPKPPGKIVAGEIIFEDRDLTKLSADEMCVIRGNQIAMIFQEPMTSLNPVLTIGKQLSEVLILHRNMDSKQALEEAVAMLKKVGIPRAGKIIKDYPHQLSGGMRQRVMIAMAMICNPKLLIADEPTTALDVTIQAQVLDLMNKMQETYGTAVIFITHDLGVVAEMADDVAVMYAGQIVETAPVDTIFANTMHPYTKALLASIPFVDQDKRVLYSIPGTVPDAADFPEGCRFAQRCDFCEADCVKAQPELREVRPGHWVRCYKADRLGGGTDDEPKHIGIEAY